MVQVQIDIDEHIDKKLRIYMSYNDISSKAEAIAVIIEEYFLIRPPRMKIDEDRYKNDK